MKTLKMFASKWVAWLIALLFLSVSISLSAEAAPDETIVLQQKCKALGGAYVVYLSKHSLRIENPSLILISQAPKWKITVLNPKKKNYFQGDYRTCLKQMETTRTPFSPTAGAILKWRKAQGETIAGLSAEQWYDDSPDKNHGRRSVRYWTLIDSQLPPQCAEIIATCYGLPAIGRGAPLQFLYKGSANSLLPMMTRQFDSEGAREQEIHWLETASMKKVQATPSLFVIPKGFKPTNNFAEAAVDTDSHNKDTEFILKDLRRHPETFFQSR